MKLKCILLLFFIGAIVADDWEDFKKKHKKSYKSKDEEGKRKNVFAKNLDIVKKHNSGGNSSYTMAINDLADLSAEEFKAMLNGAIKPEKIKRKEEVDVDEAEFQLRQAPATIDWRTLGAVTAVKNQGQCGSCWTFSAAGALEGAKKIKSGTLVDLSEQNLLDCTYSGYGCNGGWPSTSFTYVKTNGGINTESSYPYVAVKGTCRYSSSNIGATSTGFVAVSATESALKTAVGTNGPISVAIDASLSSFQFYSSGVYAPTGCATNNPDHAVLVVGYNVDSTGKPYWIIKNSWGTYWGMAGYMFMARNVGNMCGIASYATYPKV